MLSKMEEIKAISIIYTDISGSIENIAIMDAAYNSKIVISKY